MATIFHICITMFLVAGSIPVDSAPEVASPNPSRALSRTSTLFALDLYQELRNASQNIIASPISLEIVLAMVQQGAKGSTASEIAKVLHLPENGQDVLEGHKSMITGLKDPSLRLATRMFIENTFNLTSEFQNIVSEYFLSEVGGEDFKTKPEDARLKINEWVEEKTNDKIKDLISEGSLKPDTRLVLVNAIHFKNKWAVEFDKEQTRDRPFYVTPEKTVDVPMMDITETFRYMESPKLDAKILQLYYAGNNFSMIIFLPNKVDGLPELESKMVDLNYDEELSGLYSTTVHLILPKFKLEETIELNEILKKMGMATSFTGKADFSGISDEPVAISKVVQKAFIEVNEEGTEAAAATDVEFTFTSAVLPPSRMAVFHCDRPFLFHLTHLPTNVMLFVSRVQKI